MDDADIDGGDGEDDDDVSFVCGRWHGVADISAIVIGAPPPLLRLDTTNKNLITVLPVSFLVRIRFLLWCQSSTRRGEALAPHVFGKVGPFTNTEGVDKSGLLIVLTADRAPPLRK